MGPCPSVVNGSAYPAPNRHRTVAREPPYTAGQDDRAHHKRACRPNSSRCPTPSDGINPRWECSGPVQGLTVTPCNGCRSETARPRTEAELNIRPRLRRRVVDLHVELGELAKQVCRSFLSRGFV